MSKLEKVKGNKESCPSCHAEIICNEITYKGETKLQWQNADGKAHYSFNPETKKTSCKSNPASQSDEQMKIDDGDPVALWTQNIFEKENIIRATLRSLMGGEPSAEHVGMYLKLRLEK